MCVFTGAAPLTWLQESGAVRKERERRGEERVLNRRSVRPASVPLDDTNALHPMLFTGKLPKENPTSVQQIMMQLLTSV